MDKPKPNKLAQFYSGQIQPNGALSLRRSVQFWSGVDKEHHPFHLNYGFRANELWLAHQVN